jgi:radical SAM-linked protein
MKFVGHLDMMRFFQKAVRRAGINVAYSAGYSPHQLMSFAAPLGLGLVSKGEYMDIEVVGELDEKGLSALQQSLAAEMVAGVEIVAVAPLPETAKNAMASVAAAGYTVIFRENVGVGDGLPVDWYSQFMRFLQSPHIFYTKKNKKGERGIDLKPLIYEAAQSLENTGVYLVLDASSANAIKPQFVMEAFFDYIGQQNGGQDIAFDLAICREDIYARTETGEFVPLVQLAS